MKRRLKSQQSSFTKLKTEQEAATRASFRVALEIAKRGKPFTDGEMIKECIIAVAEEMCPEKVNLLKTVSMSANTVARRVENIAENISSQLFDKNGHVEWFSLALDESTDVSDTAQVLIYIRGVDKRAMKNFLICIVFTAQLLVEIFLKELKWPLIKRTFDGKT
ncbi:general transcription factor II-I repeat domain-containing protein 2 [Trichonephila clavata]|uniref:General transcription factor II-I repeat domain-containing protein 2 n=1 Tax=Trichonephila clavata TaxID=2740835 RepID=A0A8X6J4P3_TRICU|nr:general transcription factor II-I repeat domain-containing protein 2 [Trichonephila clavata]